MERVWEDLIWDLGCRVRVEQLLDDAFQGSKAVYCFLLTSFTACTSDRAQVIDAIAWLVSCRCALYKTSLGMSRHDVHINSRRL